MGICDEHAPPSADRTRGPKIELYLGDFNQLVQQAEAIILLTPLGRGHDPGLLAPLLDLLPDDAFAGKPVLLVATGSPSEHVSELQQTYAAEFRRLQANLLQPPLHIGSRAWIIVGDNPPKLARGAEDRLADALREAQAQVQGRLPAAAA